MMMGAVSNAGALDHYTGSPSHIRAMAKCKISRNGCTDESTAHLLDKEHCVSSFTNPEKPYSKLKFRASTTSPIFVVIALLLELRHHLTEPFEDLKVESKTPIIKLGMKTLDFIDQWTKGCLSIDAPGYLFKLLKECRMLFPFEITSSKILVKDSTPKSQGFGLVQPQSTS
ncbi:hypothetical protein D5086_007383 [Populus alba]|uniref:Uncharacterized protein n=1 Tax=Populus alba TaxID=43335 RepID=A0ACC4CN92_POPAL